MVFTFAVRDVLSDARHTLALFTAAGISAILLTPLVELLQRWMRRVVAVGLAVVLLLGVSGLVAWGVLGDINLQIDRLQEAAPEGGGARSSGRSGSGTSHASSISRSESPKP